MTDDRLVAAAALLEERAKAYAPPTESHAVATLLRVAADDGKSPCTECGFDWVSCRAIRIVTPRGSKCCPDCRHVRDVALDLADVVLGQR